MKLPKKHVHLCTEVTVSIDLICFCAAKVLMVLTVVECLVTSLLIPILYSHPWAMWRNVEVGHGVIHIACFWVFGWGEGNGWTVYVCVDVGGGQESLNTYVCNAKRISHKTYSHT